MNPGPSPQHRAECDCKEFYGGTCIWPKCEVSVNPDPTLPERKRLQKLLSHAHIEANEGTCNRLKVGAIIALGGRVISSGYNGAPSKLPHCGEECHEGGPPCKRSAHAEANAIAFAAKHGIATDGATMVSTDSPCLNCARLIINAGIKEVFYRREYRDIKPLEEMNKAGIRTLMI